MRPTLLLRQRGAYRRGMTSADARQFDFDPESGIPLELWLAHRRTEGWVPVPGARTLVRVSEGTRLAFRMRRMPRETPARAAS